MCNSPENEMSQKGSFPCFKVVMKHSRTIHDIDIGLVSDMFLYATLNWDSTFPTHFGTSNYSNPTYIGTHQTCFFRPSNPSHPGRISYFSCNVTTWVTLRSLRVLPTKTRGIQEWVGEDVSGDQNPDRDIPLNPGWLKGILIMAYEIIPI